MASPLSHTLRRFRQAPAFTLTVIATLGLTVGLSTTIFSVMDAVFLRPLPYPQADRMFSLRTYSPRGFTQPASYLEKAAQDESTGEMPERAAYELARAYRRLGREEDSKRSLAQFQKFKNADEQQESQQNQIRSKLQELDKSRALQTPATPNAP